MGEAEDVTAWPTGRHASGRAGVRMALLVALALTGCETVEETYARKPLFAPDPIDVPEPDPKTFGGGLKPVGTVGGGAAGRRDGLRAPEIVIGQRTTRGTTRRINTAPATVTQGPSGEGITLNFVDTSIKEVADVVLGQTLGVNYVIDDRVTGSVTARTSDPIPRANVLAVLENLLALNGAAVVASAGVYNIVPLEAVPNLPGVVVTPNRAPLRAGIATNVIPLQFAGAASVGEVVSGLVSPGNQLAVDDARNYLIYTGPAQEARAIRDLVAVLDVDVLSGKSFGLFPVHSTRAEDIAEELVSLFSAGILGDVGGRTQFLPVARLNAVLAVTARPAHLRRVDEWIRRLDRSDAEVGRQVFVYFARNSEAADLVDVLSQVFLGARPTDGGGPGDVAPTLEPVELRSPSGSLTESVTAASAVAQLGASGGNGVGVQRTGTSGRLERRAERRSDRRNRSAGQGDGPRIVAHERNNAVVVVATPDEFRLIEATLRQLDVLPLQVLIEATIAEVTLNDDLEYGLRWAFENGDLSGSLTDNLAGLVGPSFPGFNLVLDTTEATVVLSALSEVTNIEVVSSPQLMVLDNQPARLQVGDQVPVSTQNSVSTINPDSPIVSSIEYFDTGVILEVTPRVNATGLVTLEILQEVSDAVATETSGIDSPTIQQRSIQSIVSVQSGETVALGGLIRERASDSESGVPILKDIPLLGNLFKVTGQDRARTELLVLITPRVVRGPAQAREVTEALRQRLVSLRDVVPPIRR